MTYNHVHVQENHLKLHSEGLRSKHFQPFYLTLLHGLSWLPSNLAPKNQTAEVQWKGLELLQHLLSHTKEHQIGPAKFEVEQIWKMSHKLELKKCFLKQIEMEKVIYRDLPIKQ